jgi:hypothetical protein
MGQMQQSAAGFQFDLHADMLLQLGVCMLNTLSAGCLAYPAKTTAYWPLWLRHWAKASFAQNMSCRLVQQ